MFNKAWIYLALRVRVGCWEYMRVHLDTMSMERVSVSRFLYFKEHLIDGSQEDWSWELEIDLEPFSREFPKMHETRSIGRGVEFLNRRLSSRLFEERVVKRRYVGVVDSVIRRILQTIPIREGSFAGIGDAHIGSPFVPRSTG